MFDIGPFLLVMSVCIAASASLYYSFGLQDAGHSFFLMYRFIVLQDFDMKQFNAWKHGRTLKSSGSAATTGASSTQDYNQSEPGDYYWVLRVSIIMLGFMMTVSLMNLYIGVLTISYESHTHKARASYLRWRAGAVLEARALHAGWTKATMCFRSTKAKSLRRLSTIKLNRSATADSRAQNTGESHQHEEEAFMWVCVNRHQWLEKKM